MYAKIKADELITRGTSRDCPFNNAFRSSWYLTIDLSPADTIPPDLAWIMTMLTVQSEEAHPCSPRPSVSPRSTRHSRLIKFPLRHDRVVHQRVPDNIQCHSSWT
jgi:hypothetical protein